MIKRIISLFLMAVMLIPFLSGCFSESEESSAPDTSDVTPESSEVIAESTHKEIEPLVIKSFYGREVTFNKDPYEDYFCLRPEEGSEEFEQWERIYTPQPKDDNIWIYYEEGEMYEIFYTGEISQMQDSEYGFIENIYSFRIKSSPREYRGINYEVAIMRQGHSIEKIKEDTGQYYLLAKSKTAFVNMANLYFMHHREISDNATELQRKTTTLVNNRKQLLSGYNGEFFKSNDLLMFFIQAESGSIRYDVTDITIESGICTVTYEKLNPPGTTDMADWILFISIPKEISAQITEYKTYMPKPEWYP